MNLDLLVAAIPAAAIVGGAIFGLARWGAKLDENTKATEKLTDTLRKTIEWTMTQIQDHEKRITRLEARDDRHKRP